ncbi:TNFAIP3-interacting protein 1-like isoform X1 [Littorina saxatilis]|uniref:TNFAIP3-interacting protein 1-like isoform X1 n=1 Tax=Littorina saxatilis TaxID=31220 RepID=UPI0038B66CF3
MDSQSEMLEVATGSGSSSSDSIVNISRSGASSISTSASTSNTTATEKLNIEIASLKEDKKNLEGRIRGYKTLSDLLVECRKENEQLKLQVTSLTLFVKQNERMSDVDRRSIACSPFSLVSMEALRQQGKNSNPSELDMNNLSLSHQTFDNNRPTMTSPRNTISPSHISHPPVSGPPTSLQETVGPPGKEDETRLISLTTPTKGGSEPAWTPLEKMPKQESLGLISSSSPAASLSPEKRALASTADREASSADSKAGLKESLTSGSSSPELLQLDSDKYEEATYEKVGRQLGRGHAGLTGSMYGATGGRREESTRPVDFPSLSSGLSSGMVQSQPHSHSSSIYNPPFMAMRHQSQMGAASDKPNSGLAAEVETITERLNSEPGDSSPAIAFQMHQIAERISRLEQKERDQKKLIDTLMRENQDLKRQVKMTDSSHQSETVQLREQNTRLMQQLKSQNRGEETSVLKASGTHGDWVHVERSLHTGESLNASDQSLVDRVRKLEQEKAELQRANSNWKSQWDKMEQSQQIKMGDLRSKLAMTEQELSTFRARLAEQASEFESRMLEMKRRIEEEENQKEDAQHRLCLAERQVTELSDQLNEVRTQLSDTARDKQALAAEISVLKAHATGQEKQMTRAGGSRSGSQAALEGEIAMLKEQLKVFAEDFEHEREDRTTAQSARDAAKKNAETLTRQNHSLNSQVKHLQKQIKDRDDTISWTLRQNETLQRQQSDFKKKLASEWEEKQNLQRMLTLAQRQQQQQQQQQHQQQPMRNPYLQHDPQPAYSSAGFYQPPLQPPTGPRTVPYYSGQGLSQPLNRTAPAAMSPEHLPGAWTCVACTYINYPGRTVCESCGLVNSPRADNYGYNSHDMYGSSDHALLMSRGGEQNGQGPTNGGDLVIDSGAWATPIAQ